VTPFSALAIGALGTMASNVAMNLRHRSAVDGELAYDHVIRVERADAA